MAIVGCVVWTALTFFVALLFIPVSRRLDQANGQICGIAEINASFNKFLNEGTVSILYFGFQRRDRTRLFSSHCASKFELC